MEMYDHQRSFLELLAGDDQPLLGRRNSFLALEQNGSGGARTSDDNNGKVNCASDGETNNNNDNDCYEDGNINDNDTEI